MPPANDKSGNASVINENKPAEHVEADKNRPDKEENSDNKRDTDNNQPDKKEEQVKADTEKVVLDSNQTDGLQHETETKLDSVEQKNETVTSE